jgi:GNAT superfamily N-acetyltransferase
MSADEVRRLEVRCRNWSEYPSIRDVILRIREMDDFCFGKLATEDWGTVDGWDAIAHKNPYMNVCLEVDGVVMGSVHWLWLNRTARDHYLAGQLRDGMIRPEDTVGVPPQKEPVYLYLLSMMVHPQYQGVGYLRRLWNHAVMEQAEWRKKGMVFEEAYATAWSEAGITIITRAGGEVIGEDQFHHRMYKLPVPVRKLFRKDDPTSNP